MSIHTKTPFLFLLYPAFPSPIFLISTFVLPLPFSHRNPFISASLLPPLLPHLAGWTWLPWLGCAARGRNCPVSTRSCSETCRMSSTRPGICQSTAMCWAARACNLPSSPCSPSSRRTSPSYMKVYGFVEGISSSFLHYFGYEHVATFPFGLAYQQTVSETWHVILHGSISPSSSVLRRRSIAVSLRRFTSA